MAIIDLVKKYQQELKTPLEENKSNFDIDKFETSVINGISNYWNESIIDLYNTLENILPNIQDFKTNEDGHDAGYHFKNAKFEKDAESNFVNPDRNALDEVYLKAREDEIYSVLHNNDNMDYTIADSDLDNDGDIDFDDVKIAVDDIRKYILRLLMPQYKRRVEIEDLDRNFWVIGQNLTTLNKFAFQLSNFPIKNLIAELMGLWDNIYRIWQALQELEDELNDYFNQMKNTDKVRLMFDYGFGQYDGAGEKKAIIFTKANAKYYGVLPYISLSTLKNENYKDSDNKTKIVYTCYVQYNKKLTDDFIGTTSIYNEDTMTDKEKLVYKEKNTELIENLKTNKNGLIRLEEDTKIKRDMIKVLRKIRQRNFTLIGHSQLCNTFSNLISVDHPFSRIVDFYRDYLYLVTSPTIEESLEEKYGEIYNEEGESNEDRQTIWEQMGYLRQLNLLGYTDSNNYDESPWSGETEVPIQIPYSYKFLQVLDSTDTTIDIDGLINSNYIEAFVDKVANYTDTFKIEDLQGEIKTQAIKENNENSYKSYKIHNLVRGFYNLLDQLFIFFYKKEYISEDIYTEYKNKTKYNTLQSNIMQLNKAYITEKEGHPFYYLAQAIKNYEKNESLDGSGTFVFFTGGLLPYINWDLVSMSNYDKGVEWTSSLSVISLDSCLSVIDDFGSNYFYKWIEDGKEDHIWVDFVNNIIYDKKNLDTHSTIGTYTENDIRKTKINKDNFLYDFIITTPLRKEQGSSTQENIPAYENFIRFNKPYPNILALNYDNASLYKSFFEASMANYLEDISDTDKWLAVEDSSSTIWSCYDGFYCLTRADYSKIKEKSLINTDDLSGKILLTDLLNYHVSSSDLIDYKHTEDGTGQTFMTNEHNFIDPVVNIRFINGRSHTYDTQEIEVIITKDETEKPYRDDPTPTTTVTTKTFNLPIIFTDLNGGNTMPEGQNSICTAIKDTWKANERERIIKANIDAGVKNFFIIGVGNVPNYKPTTISGKWYTAGMYVYDATLIINKEQKQYFTSKNNAINKIDGSDHCYFEQFHKYTKGPSGTPVVDDVIVPDDDLKAKSHSDLYYQKASDGVCYCGFYFNDATATKHCTIVDGKETNVYYTLKPTYAVGVVDGYKDDYQIQSKKSFYSYTEYFKKTTLYFA